MLFPALLIILTSILQLCGAQLTPVVDLGYAKYRGTFNSAGSNNTQFLGIRFAEPPTGSLRWQAPRTPGFVAGIQNATAEPPGCLQAGTGAAPTNTFPANKRTTLAVSNPEDCLFLNVHTPGQLDSHGPGKSLPVVVWIHGGGYVAGNAGSFDGNDLLRESGNGVVAVIIQYRLGLFGFLAGEAVKANGRLNAGLLDQQFALQWIQEHIAKFGGDPGRVTIWGESAGAGSVLQQVIANDGRTFPPLFRAAITSSSFLPSQYAFNDVVPEFLYNSVVSKANCTSAANSLACLRNADVNLLEQININLCGSGFFGTFVFVPVVDGDFIKQRPALALLEGKVNGEALMSITNANEGSLFVNQSTASTVQIPEYLTQLFPSLSAQNRNVAVEKYSGLGAPIDQVDAIMGESIFVCPTYFLLRAFQGKRAFKASWKGQFAIPPATHGMDVAFYFTYVYAVPAFNNADFDEAFADSFLAFVVSLDPNHTFEPTITPDWNPFSFQQGHQVEMRFNRTASGDPAVSPFTTPEDLLDRCSSETRTLDSMRASIVDRVSGLACRCMHRICQGARRDPGLTRLVPCMTRHWRPCHVSSPVGLRCLHFFRHVSSQSRNWAGLTPVIDLGYARYRGTLDPAGSNNTQFLGIRFAAPPTGSLRWQAPRTPGFVAGIQNATAEPPRCLQGGTGAAPNNSFPANKRDTLAVPNSEDCLFLNVYIPGQPGPRSPRKSLPVVVWIHGGGYVAGSANGFSGPDSYNGNDLVRESGDGVVAVVIQYRLGLFGFLAGEEVKANGRLNAGLLDQQFALQWVQEHIAKFGGDPGRVTIWGESAGAGSVLQQVIANDGKTFPPLFRAAITSSSFLPSQYAFNDVVPEFLFNTVVSRTNCTPAANSLTCLRNADINVLEQINVDLCGSGFFGTFVFVPVVDGDFIKQRPALALLEGKVNGEALMSVTNADEGAIFVDSSTAGTVQVPEYLMQLFPSLSAQHRDVAVTKYSGLGTPIDQVTAIMGVYARHAYNQSIFVCPTYFLLRAFKGRAFKANADIKFNQGQFAIPPATHGMDVSFYFPSYVQCHNIFNCIIISFQHECKWCSLLQ
ncbi:Alpha/Beta hydrolase protein [Armillaria nabsnona]|nr:Alpha/Beta hydrolase protein [Armillaria nabsnona]